MRDTSVKVTRLQQTICCQADTSDIAVSAILLQKYDDRFHSIAYFSKKYLPAERN